MQHTLSHIAFGQGFGAHNSQIRRFRRSTCGLEIAAKTDESLAL